MGKRYYCEYCDKSFVETPDAVRKHRNGLTHQILLKDHYAGFKDHKTILAEESVKQPCFHRQTGECKFGANCRFSHYTKEQLDYLRWQVEQTELAKHNLESNSEQKNYHTWFMSRRKRGLEDSEALKKLFSQQIHLGSVDLYEVTSWKYPEILDTFTNLPPSLKKLTLEDFQCENKEEWG